MGKLLELTESGLYCPEGDFHIDPWRPVARAIITHAHSDHARIGSRNYLTTPEGAGVLRLRVTGDWVTEQGYAPPQITTLPYGQTRNINGVSVSLHP
ncbi:MAG: hypothetical protein KDE54_29255, partial [Caldilineaceae bacterium]|nr:hypothetical protein [Caldilineaceae bacterium]